MNPNKLYPDPSPTPEQLAAWVDGELSPPEARRIEGWLSDHPEVVREVDSLHQVTRLFRDHSAPVVTPARWQAALERIEPRVRPLSEIPRRNAWRLRLVVGLTLASAALVGAVALARALWPISPAMPGPIVSKTIPLEHEQEDGDPFPVSAMSEVNIIRMDAEDADRIVTGQPVMGSIEFVSDDDIRVLGVEADPTDGHMARLARGRGMPMIVVAKGGDDEP